MHRFFVPPESIVSDVVAIPQPQARQIARVLRLAPGDQIVALDDTGVEYEVADGDSTPPLTPRETGEFATRPEGYVSGMGYCLPAMVAAFQMDQGEVQGVFEGRRAAYIVQLVERTDADLEAMTDAETTNLRTRAMTTKGGTYFGVWYEDIRDSAVIERNEEVIGAF